MEGLTVRSADLAAVEYWSPWGRGGEDYDAVAVGQTGA